MAAAESPANSKRSSLSSLGMRSPQTTVGATTNHHSSDVIDTGRALDNNPTTSRSSRSPLTDPKWGKESSANSSPKSLVVSNTSPTRSMIPEFDFVPEQARTPGPERLDRDAEANQTGELDTGSSNKNAGESVPVASPQSAVAVASPETAKMGGREVATAAVSEATTRSSSPLSTEASEDEEPKSESKNLCYRDGQTTVGVSSADEMRMSMHAYASALILSQHAKQACVQDMSNSQISTEQTSSNAHVASVQSTNSMHTPASKKHDDGIHSPRTHLPLQVEPCKEREDFGRFLSKRTPVHGHAGSSVAADLHIGAQQKNNDGIEARNANNNDASVAVVLLTPHRGDTNNTEMEKSSNCKKENVAPVGAVQLTPRDNSSKGGEESCKISKSETGIPAVNVHLTPRGGVGSSSARVQESAVALASSKGNATPRDDFALDRVHGFVREGGALGLGLSQSRLSDPIRVWDMDTQGTAYLSAAIR